MNRVVTEKEIWENTPSFVLDKLALEENLNTLKDALQKYWPNYKIGYSYKTCAIPWLLRYLKKEKIYAEVVSPEEFYLAKRIGYEAKDIIYNGPIKTKSTIEEALSANAVINLDSQREITWVKEIVGNNPDQQFTVGLRVNFNVEEHCEGETVAGKKGNRFGFSYEKKALENAVNSLAELKNLNISGLHMHVSSKSRSNNLYSTLARKAIQIAAELNLQLSYIDIGGGFFAGGDFNSRFYDYIKNIAEELSEKYTAKNLTLIVEPGASLIASPISLYSRVIDVKDSFIERLVVTDASRCLIDPFMHKTSYQYEHVESGANSFLQSSLSGFLPNELLAGKFLESRQTKETQTICGYTCMENDRLMQLENEQEIKIGDGIIYHTVGSYTICFNPLFIKYLPSVYLKKENQFVLIREAWKVDNFLTGDISVEYEKDF
ncbi:MAG TPA: pyridoxal-dependent decarboxylase [Clostridiaceae bacterium]|nr:pyridoxal-dependent decarboxylase [Clostridiaceae bacterium]